MTGWATAAPAECNVCSNESLGPTYIVKPFLRLWNVTFFSIWLCLNENVCVTHTWALSLTLYDVFRATVAAELVYCSPAWSGFCSAADITRIEAFFKRCKLYGYCADGIPNISTVFSDADDCFLLLCFKKFHPLLVCATSFLILNRFW